MLACQGISTDWLRTPNERDRRSVLEYSRGVFHGLSFASDGEEIRSRPVHVNRIRSAFAELGAPAMYRVGLRLLNLLGEAESLAGGYWLIAPFRVVPMQSMYAFVGCVPSNAIGAGQIRYCGLSRLVEERYSVEYLRQSLEDWMGKRVASTSAYVVDFLQCHRKSAAPALSSSEIEYLHLVSRNSNAVQVIWSDKPGAILTSEKLALCRQSDVGIYRYFSAELSNGRIAAESSLRHSLPRLIWAIASAAAIPFRVNVAIAGNTARICVPIRLPSEEYRLALLLATGIARQGAATVYEMDADVAPVFVNALKKLGCQLETES